MFMHLPRRSPWLLPLSLLLFTALSCNPKNQNGNQSAANANPQQAKAGRWVEQWRSPTSKGFEGTPLARFAYTCISVVSADDVLVGGDIPDPKGSDTRVGIFVKTTDGGKTWAEMTLERADMQVTTINAIHFVNPTTGWLAGVTAKQQGVVLRTTD